MSEKKCKVRAECPFRICGVTSRPSPKVLRSKYTPRPLCRKKVKIPRAPAWGI